MNVPQGSTDNRPAFVMKMKFHNMLLAYFACNFAAVPSWVPSEYNILAPLSDAIYVSQKLTAYDVYKLLFMGLNPALPAQVGIWLHFSKLCGIHSTKNYQNYFHIQLKMLIF